MCAHAAVSPHASVRSHEQRAQEIRRRNTIRRRKRVRHRIEPRHGDPRRLHGRIGREADEHAARRRSLDGRNRRAAEPSLERAICRRAVVDLHKVFKVFGFERVEAQVDRRARYYDVLAADAAGIVSGDGDGSVRCGESSRRVRARTCTRFGFAAEYLPVLMIQSRAKCMIQSSAKCVYR
jgi:hypothetical protein